MKLKIFDMHRMLKDQFDFDIVMIQCGYFFETYKEDAEYFQNEFNFEVFDRGINVLGTGFPVWSIDKWIDIFEEKNLTYAIVEQIDSLTEGNLVGREVTLSTDEEAIGLTFNVRKKVKLNYNNEKIKYEKPKKFDSPLSEEEDKLLKDKFLNSNDTIDNIANYFKRSSSFIIKYLKESKLIKHKQDLIKLKFPNAYKKWDTNLDNKLKELFLKEETIENISNYFQRTKGSIISRLIKIGLIEDDSDRLEIIKRDNLLSGRPEHHGLAWTKESRKLLLEKLKNNESLQQTAKFFKRSLASIRNVKTNNTMDIEKLKRDNLTNGRPENYGLPWTKEDEKTLKEKFKNNESIQDITKYFKRSHSAIIKYLKKYELID